jgi:hypothetical protein
MTDSAQGSTLSQVPALPPQLEARIAVVESAAPTTDFDASSWFWMVLLGVAIPLILLAVGWWA